MGNMDIQALERLIETECPVRVPIVVLSVTNNSGGGKLVSTANIRGGEGGRFAAWNPDVPGRLPLLRKTPGFSASGETEFAGWIPKQIAQKMFSYVYSC